MKATWKETLYPSGKLWRKEFTVTSDFRIFIDGDADGWRVGPFGRTFFPSLAEAKRAAIKDGIKKARQKAKIYLSIADCLKNLEE